MTDLAEIPTLATLAFHGLVAEPQSSITEADLFDPEVESALADREDWERQDEDESFDPDLGWYGGRWG